LESVTNRYNPPPELRFLSDLSTNQYDLVGFIVRESHI
jgi:hypothetical protein